MDRRAPIGGAPPITSDPPFHNIARRLLLPAFAPKMIEPWESEIQRLCQKLLDDMGEITPGESIVDAAVQYAQNIPVNVIGRMLGFPEKDEELFRKFVHDVLERIAEEPGTGDGTDDLGLYIQQQIEEHRENPRDDLTSFLMNVELDGNKLDDQVVAGMVIFIPSGSKASTSPSRIPHSCATSTATCASSAAATPDCGLRSSPKNGIRPATSC